MHLSFLETAFVVAAFNIPWHVMHRYWFKEIEQPMTTTEIIQELDELRAKATQGEWCMDNLHTVLRHGRKNDVDFCEHEFGKPPHADDSDTQYIIALNNAFPALRQAILERDEETVTMTPQAWYEIEKKVGELLKYKAAGEALAEAVAQGHQNCMKNEWYACGWDSEAALYAYRTAIDEKNV